MADRNTEIKLESDREKETDSEIERETQRGNQDDDIVTKR